MKLRFLELTSDERRQYIEQASGTKDVSSVVLEKDFWVCWLLGLLFESKFAPHLVFKGGTSLSKVFGVINRFSEDIDLSLSPLFLSLPIAGTSRTQSDKWMKRAEEACSVAVRDLVQPSLEEAVAKFLGQGEPSWFQFFADPATNSPVLLFRYPSSLPTGFEYLRRDVKLEFGSLTDQQPTGRYPVTPWISEILPVAFPDWRCEVVALEVERSFWEKATILHAEFHRPPDKPIPDRYSRHYADMAALALHPVAGKAANDHQLCQRVVEWKRQFFGRPWAHYDQARPGSFHLVPPAERIPSLRRDYQAMRDMYLAEPSSFDEIISVLADLEGRINRPGKR